MSANDIPEKVEYTLVGGPFHGQTVSLLDGTRTYNHPDADGTYACDVTWEHKLYWTPTGGGLKTNK